MKGVHVAIGTFSLTAGGCLGPQFLPSPRNSREVEKLVAEMAKHGTTRQSINYFYQDESVSFYFWCINFIFEEKHFICNLFQIFQFITYNDRVDTSAIAVTKPPKLLTMSATSEMSASTAV